MKPIDVSTPVVILGFHHGSLGIARSLGRLGISVYGIDADRDAPGLESRYLKGSTVWDFRAISPHVSLDFLLHYADQVGGRPLLIATSDDAALFIAQNSEALSKRYLFPRLPLETVRTLCDKKSLFHLCKKLDVPTPETAFPTNAEEVSAYAREAQFPVMVKGIDGLKLERRTGKKMAIAHSPLELLRYYSELEDPADPNIMLQEYIPGGDDTIWMFNGYFDSSSRCRAAFTGKKLRQHPIHTGATSLGIVLENDKVAQLTIEFMQRIRYRGILDIGWRYDARDGSYKLLDPNPRIGSTFRLFLATDDMDVVRFLYLDQTGQPLPVSEQREGRKWLVEDRDLESTLDYMREGTLSTTNWLRSFKGVEESAWYARDDLRPFWLVARKTLKRGFAKLFKRRGGGPGALMIERDNTTELKPRRARQAAQRPVRRNAAGGL
ncbi:MAG: carboxylate--amine ligase [Gemmatimonadota bacterium]